MDLFSKLTTPLKITRSYLIRSLCFGYFSTLPHYLMNMLLSSSSFPLNFSKFKTCPPCYSSSSSSSRVVCYGVSQPQDFKFVLHQTSHARDARKEFVTQIEKLNSIERQTSISVNKRVDLWKTALFIAAEDEVSDSFHVDSFINILYDLSMDFASRYFSSLSSSPENFLQSLDTYLFSDKGFSRSNGDDQADPRALYLHSVLMHGSGSAAILSLIYTEIMKVLRMWSLVDFDFEIFFPHDRRRLPKGYIQQRCIESDQPHIMTTQTLLEEMLRNLKETFWPFQHGYSKSSFLRAADAANCIAEESEFQLATAKAPRHSLGHGVWTSVPSGDMRRALSACERLILIESDPKELRDYSILLYHCGLYDQSLQYLKLYQESKQRYSLEIKPSNKLHNQEEDAEKHLMTRLTLISMEEGWSRP